MYEQFNLMKLNLLTKAVWTSRVVTYREGKPTVASELLPGIVRSLVSEIKKNTLRPNVDTIVQEILRDFELNLSSRVSQWLVFDIVKEAVQAVGLDFDHALYGGKNWD